MQQNYQPAFCQLPAWFATPPPHIKYLLSIRKADAYTVRYKGSRSLELTQMDFLPSSFSYVTSCTHNFVQRLFALLQRSNEPGGYVRCSPVYINFSVGLSSTSVVFNLSQRILTCFVGHEMADYHVQDLHTRNCNRKTGITTLNDTTFSAKLDMTW
jgi:hypothetical protein